MNFKNKAQAKRDTGLGFIGSVSSTVKHKKSIEYGELTYSVYLAPAKTSGYETCKGRTAECTALCLNESGMNRMSMKDEAINKSRIAKTKLFFEEKDYFMQWMIFEIEQAKAKAEKKGFEFSVRLNNTSDISPLDFVFEGKNILEIFPDVMFYDYTKVFERISIAETYSNYDLTFSYTGYNAKKCTEVLKKGLNVAMVFKNVPETYNNFAVIDGDKNDMRYKDVKGVIVGLKYKATRKKLPENTKFVIQ